MSRGLKKLYTRQSTMPAKSLSWKALIAVTVLSTCFYLFMEWLFLATKPSFMSALDIWGKLELLIRIGPSLVLAVTVIIIMGWMLSLVIKKDALEKLLLTVMKALPAFVLSCSFFLLSDNFTITVLGWGIRSAGGLWRLGYGALFVFLFIFSYRTVGNVKRRLEGSTRHVNIVLILTAVGILAAAVQLVNANRSPSPAGQRQTERSGPRASILLLSSDGVNAENSSVYGYSRDTTPFLRQFSAEALVCQNAFANAAVTGASIAALLTGKLPTQTRLIYPPDILKGEDAYQHLPAIPRNEGYRSIHLSIRHYADPYDLNLRHSFDSSNFRRLDEHQIPETLSRLAGLQGAYLFEILMDRLVGRLFHAFGWREMENPYRQVTETTKSYRRDAVLVKELLTFLEDSPSPFFAHLHLLGTHGPYFHPQRAHFSAGKTQDEEWMRDFYDDAIVDFDGYLKQIIDYLKRLGRLNETLVIITSDHGRSFATDVRIPLLFRFPGGEYSGTVTQNAQTIDIAPTVLNYLGIARPSWMTGESLIISQPEPDRPIFSAFPLTVGRTRKKTGLVANPAAMEPPFYSLRAVGMIHCQKWYRLELLHPRLFVSQIDGHTAPCGDPEQRKFDEAADMMVDHLSDNGYDTSSIFRFGAVKAPSGFSEAGLPAIPFSLKDTHPALLEDTSIGVSLVNLASLESELVAVGRDGKGWVRYATHLGPLSKKTFMTHELAGPKSKQDFLQIQSSGDDLHALCMVADESLRRLERIGGDLIPLKEFYLPVARSEHEEITVVFLFNPDLQESAQVVLNLMGRQGRILKQSRLLLPPRETHLGTLGQIFGAGLRIREGYLRVQSTHDLQAFEVVASQTALSALPAQKTLSGARVWVPHFLIDRAGRSTQLRLINSGKATFRVMVRVADYQAHTLRMIPPCPLHPGSSFSWTCATPCRHQCPQSSHWRAIWK